MPPDSDFKAVYVRDFNLDDPDLLFYYIDSEGRDSFQGCYFDASRQPRCGRHIFLQQRPQSKPPAYGFAFRLFSRRSNTCMAGRHCATLAFGSRPSLIAAKNSRSCSSIPFIDTATFERSIGC